MEAWGTWRHVDLDHTPRRGAFRAAREGRRWVLEDGHGKLLVVSDERRDFIVEAGALSRLPPGLGWSREPAGLLLRPETWQFDDQSTWLRLDAGASDSVADRVCTVRRFRLAPDHPSFRLWTDNANGRYLRFEGETNPDRPLSVRLTSIEDGDDVRDWAAKRFQLLDQNVDFVPPSLTSTSMSTERAARVLSQSIARLVADGALPAGAWSVETVRDQPSTRSWTLTITRAGDRVGYIDCRDVDAAPYEYLFANTQRWGALYWQMAIDHEPVIPDGLATTLMRCMRQHVIA